MTAKLVYGLSILYLSNGEWVELLEMSSIKGIPDDDKDFQETMTSIHNLFYKGDKVELVVGNEHLLVRGLDIQTSIFKIVPVYQKKQKGDIDV